MLQKNSLSTVVILLIALVFIAILTITIPISSFFKHDFRFTSGVILQLASPIICLLVYYVDRWLVNRKMRVQLKRYTDFDMVNEIDFKEEDKSSLTQKNLLFKVIGDSRLVITDNIPVGEIKTVTLGKENFVLIPATFLARFRNYPHAFYTVLVHEIFHVINRDSLLLFEIGRFIRAVFIVYVLNLLFSFYSSMSNDGLSLAAIVATVVGKVYHLSLLALAISLLLIRGLLHDWREALADRFTIEKVGQENYDLANSLLTTGANNRTIKPGIKKLQKSLTLTPFWVATTGFLIGLIADNLGGLIHYLSSISPGTSILQGIATVSADIISQTLFFTVLLVLAKNDENGKSISVIIRNSVFLLIGKGVSYVLIGAIPLSITSWLMPVGYDYIVRVDPWQNLLISFCQGLFNADLVLPTILTIILINSNRVYLGSFCILLFHLLYFLELKYFIELCSGLAVFIIAAILCTIGLVIQIGKEFLPSAKPQVSLWVLLFSGVNLVNLLGYGDLNIVGNSLNKTGLHYLDKSNFSAAEKSFKAGCAFSKLDPIFPYNVCISQAQQNKMNEALQSIDCAVNCAGLYQWEQKFKILSFGGALRLNQRSRDDLKVARSYLVQAENLWRNNSRLPKEDVSVTLYNLSCVYAISEEDSINAAIYLIEAMFLHKDVFALAKNAASDGDLKILSLNNPQNYDQHIFKKLEKKIQHLDAVDLRLKINSGEVSYKELIALIEYYVFNR